MHIFKTVVKCLEFTGRAPIKKKCRPSPANPLDELNSEPPGTVMCDGSNEEACLSTWKHTIKAFLKCDSWSTSVVGCVSEYHRRCICILRVEVCCGPAQY